MLDDDEDYDEKISIGVKSKDKSGSLEEIKEVKEIAKKEEKKKLVKYITLFI